jgi:hypothetical protein
MLVGRMKRKKERKREKTEAAGVFFPRARARHALLAGQSRIFMGVGCN